MNSRFELEPKFVRPQRQARKISVAKVVARRWATSEWPRIEMVVARLRARETALVAANELCRFSRSSSTRLTQSLEARGSCARGKTYQFHLAVGKEYEKRF